MSFQTPKGFAERCTYKDETAEHQIRIQRQRGGNDYMIVTCTCRSILGHSNNGRTYESIAPVQTADEAWAEWWAFHDAMPAVDTPPVIP